ncbi:MAG TPA: transposase [Solimonas sp.]|nr:transposase [Solimonas sp.]
MSNYIRAFVPGGTFFFTVCLADRSQVLLVEQADLLRRCFERERLAHPFLTDAAVVLPDHRHCIWTLPPNDGDFSNRWRRIKAAFSAALPESEHRSRSRLQRGERGIWQRRFWEHSIRDERDLAAHIDYIHFNPVKHGYADCAADWPLSSFNRYVEQSRLPADWGGDFEPAVDPPD